MFHIYFLFNLLLRNVKNKNPNPTSNSISPPMAHSSSRSSYLRLSSSIIAWNFFWNLILVVAIQTSPASHTLKTANYLSYHCISKLVIILLSISCMKTPMEFSQTFGVSPRSVPTPQGSPCEKPSSRCSASSSPMTKASKPGWRKNESKQGWVEKGRKKTSFLLWVKWMVVFFREILWNT